jgi:hypothetical protein
VLKGEQPMYVVVRRYSGASALVDAMTGRQDEVRSLISGVAGFRAYYAVNGGSGVVATVTVCDTKEGTDESTRLAGAWVRENLAGASISAPEITEGEAYISF